MPSEYTNNFNKLQDAIIGKKSVEISYKNYQNQYSDLEALPSNVANFLKHVLTDCCMSIGIYNNFYKTLNRNLRANYGRP